jgi:hypothetical protein
VLQSPLPLLLNGRPDLVFESIPTATVHNLSLPEQPRRFRLAKKCAFLNQSQNCRTESQTSKFGYGKIATRVSWRNKPDIAYLDANSCDRDAPTCAEADRALLYARDQARA